MFSASGVHDPLPNNVGSGYQVRNCYPINNGEFSGITQKYGFLFILSIPKPFTGFKAEGPYSGVEKKYQVILIAKPYDHMFIVLLYVSPEWSVTHLRRGTLVAH